jgi:predicted transcriptional regulator
MSNQSQLTRREREIMDILFALGGEGTITAIQEKMSDAPTRPALRSLLTILESKGHLKHRKEGREFVYAPMRSLSKEGQSTLSRVVSTFFNGSLTQAIASYLSNPQTRFTEEEIAELSSLIEQAKARRTDAKKPR